jgi:hypothetical protein
MKFNSYASFHVSANEEDFPSISNARVWPSGCLIAPFYGNINPDQIYSSEEPVLLTSKTTPIATLSSGNGAMAVASWYPLDNGL